MRIIGASVSPLKRDDERYSATHAMAEATGKEVLLRHKQNISPMLQLVLDESWVTNGKWYSHSVKVAGPPGTEQGAKPKAHYLRTLDERF
jgi:hypothetical protein